MRTRRGLCYPRVHVKAETQKSEKRGRPASASVEKNCRKKVKISTDSGVKVDFFKRFPDDLVICILRKKSEKRRRAESDEDSGRKKARVLPESGGKVDFFDVLPDDLLISILCKLSSQARSPADFMGVLLTCRRLNSLAMHSLVLSKAAPGAFSVKSSKWCESATRFMKRCADSGNVEACFTLGMIRFYCLQNRGSGASLMAKAAMVSHAPALYSLAVIQFNGSGGSKSDKDLRAGVALCARAASLGHVDALRELGHCLQDGYGVPKNIPEGRRFLVQANARELASVLSMDPHSVDPRIRGRAHPWLAQLLEHRVAGCPLLSDFGCNVPLPEASLASKFLGEWFRERGLEGGLRMCSHASCGRAETRRHEFRRCSVCGAVNYCSRACQALDWKVRHKRECKPVEARWLDELADEEEEEEEAEAEEEEQGDESLEE
ncbi:hypothetical protein AMTRI_Chr06g172040 [Amborella trichopoda]